MVAFTASSVRCRATPQAAEAPSAITSNPLPEPRATVLLTWEGKGAEHHRLNTVSEGSYKYRN